MKQFLLLILISSFIVQTNSAQDKKYSIGIELRPNITKAFLFGYDHQHHQFRSAENFKFSRNATLMFEFSAIKNWKFFTGITYVGVGHKLKYAFDDYTLFEDMFDSHNNTGGYEDTFQPIPKKIERVYNIEFVGIPVGGKYFISDRLYAKARFDLLVYTGTKEVSTYFFDGLEPSENENYAYLDYYHPLNISMSIGLGYYQSMNEKLGFFLEPNFEYLTMEVKSSEVKRRYYSIGISTGVLFL